MATWDYKERADVKLQLDDLKSSIDREQSIKIEEVEKKFSAYYTSTNNSVAKYCSNTEKEISRIRKEILYLEENYQNIARMVLKNREARNKELSIMYVLIIFSAVFNGILCLLK